MDTVLTGIIIILIIITHIGVMVAATIMVVMVTMVVIITEECRFAPVTAREAICHSATIRGLQVTDNSNESIRPEILSLLTVITTDR